MRISGKILTGALLVWICLGAGFLNVHAADAYHTRADTEEEMPDKMMQDKMMQDKKVEEVLEKFDFGEIDEELHALFPEERLDFKETLAGVLSGDISFTAELLNRLVSEQLLYAYSGCRENLIHMIFLAIIAAVFSNFGELFKSRQISQTSFYVLYLLMISLCLNAFGSVVEWTAGGIESLVSFMGAFCPVYFLAVTIASGSITAAAFYNLALLLIFVVEFLIVKLLLPLVHMCMMVKILNFLSEEDYLSRFASLIETVISWSLKTLLACVAGLNIMQGLISPAIDSVKRSVVTKGAEAIPGIGDALGGAAEIVLGTAVLVKNGIGVAGAVICFALCIYPLAQTGCIVLMYKLAAAILQPVSDKRIIGCIESVSSGCQILMKVIFTTGLLFLFTIVIVSAAAQKG